MENKILESVSGRSFEYCQTVLANKSCNEGHYSVKKFMHGASKYCIRDIETVKDIFQPFFSVQDNKYTNTTFFDDIVCNSNGTYTAISHKDNNSRTYRVFSSDGKHLFSASGNINISYITDESDMQGKHVITNYKSSTLIEIDDLMEKVLGIGYADVHINIPSSNSYATFATHPKHLPTIKIQNDNFFQNDEKCLNFLLSDITSAYDSTKNFLYETDVNQTDETSLLLTTRALDYIMQEQLTEFKQPNEFDELSELLEATC